MTTISAIPPEALEGPRRTGVDAGGGPVERLVAEGGEQLRCCLQPAEPGAAILLLSYWLPIPDSPYRASSAVFACAERCDGHTGGYPQGWVSKPQVFRAYDPRGWIHPATRVFDGVGDPIGVLAEMLAEPEVAQVFGMNVSYGCYVFRATRSAPQP